MVLMPLIEVQHLEPPSDHVSLRFGEIGAGLQRLAAEPPGAEGCT